ncbi:uncharacterized protein LOC131245742 [Magnolia sinica]|uniref:uncharacterized protein LOC131245742 n=1 Tax=Magnolia sinica TaxID=86752 RepID=UPI0026597DCD|nr:uncharacterized protein LOC131245742 [Magnolia sinica]
MQAESSCLSFHVNGKKVCVKSPNPKMLLGDFLREEMGLMGLQMPCRQGGCGSCTVVLSSDAVNAGGICSCLMPLCSVDGMNVTTIEGVGSLKAGLSSLQQAIVDHCGTQCGFCTPGMIMSLHGLISDKSQPTAQEIEDQIDGNLCRCTGYRPIFDAFHSSSGVDTQFTCPVSRNSHCKNHNIDIEDISRSLPARLVISGEDVLWIRALALQDLYDILRTNSGKRKVRMIRGNTSTGVYPRVDFDILVDISHIPSLTGTSVSSKGIFIGGAVTLSDLMLLLKKHNNLSKSYMPIFNHLKRVATPQVRAVGSVAGNLMMAHQHADFVTDVGTILMAAESRLTICSACSNESEETVDLERFFKMEMEDKVIVQIFIPALPANSHFATRKVALRKVNSHPIVNAAFKIQVDVETGLVLTGPIIVYGGIQPYPQRAQKTEKELVGKSFKDPEVFKKCLSELQKELVVDSSFGQSKYRAFLMNYFFYYFLLSTYPKDTIPHNLLSAVTQIERPISSGTISYGVGDPSEYPVSLPIPKLSSAAQATGEVEYLDDLKFSSLHAAYVLSSVSNAVIEAIDPSKAFAVRGVMAFLSAETIAADGYSNQVSEYETVFASNKVQYHGQAVGLVVAATKDIAIAAAEMVVIKYSDVKEPIITIEDAIRANSFFDSRDIDFAKGNVESSFGVADVIVEGEVYVGHQYHFHLESQRALCIPGEEGCMVVYSSTQNPSQVQQCVSVALNRPQHKITVNVKRVGGAYGAKLNRTPPVAMACAMAADILQKPVRLVLDLHTNMKLVGGRSPYLCQYKAGANRNGRITAIQMNILNNQGAHFDFEYPDLSNLPVFIDGVYNVENWNIKGRIARTNLPACTYMRGPVFVETAVMIETVLEHISHEVHVEPSIVRDLNMYDKGDVTLYSQHLADCNAKLVLHHLQESSDYIKRCAEVKAFNRQNKWVKRGISLIPVKFSAAWEGLQMISLVNIHTDASISIYQSGCEIGQGLDIKVAQVAAMVLGTIIRDQILLDEIYVHTTTTIVANNVGESGGSVTSELCARSVQNACETLVSRLEDIANLIATSEGKPTWHELIAKALDAGVDLQARGRVYPRASPLGPFQYISFAAAVSEAEVNILSGETTILRADILLDCGKSLNPAVDIGQLQGAFVQGLGYHLTEKYIYDQKTGRLTTDGTWTYKPPSSKDIPIVLNASLLPNSSNPYGVLRSKFSGEPPYATACSALFAVRQAIAAGKSEWGDSKWFGLNSPATVEEVARAADVPSHMLNIPGI